MALVPRKLVPPLEVATVSGSRWKLHEQHPERFTMLVFYRGLHCPVCRTYIGELDRLHQEFTKRGVAILALSSDSQERAEQTRLKWGLKNLELGYGVSIEEARKWGLFISTSRGTTSAGIEEPALFSEPGIFLIRSDDTLYWSMVSSMPFARPHFEDIVKAVDFVVTKNYPARGEA